MAAPATSGRPADRALVLAVATLALLTPPAITLFDRPVAILGVPLLHIYCFAVWLIAIALSAAISARLAKADAAGGTPGGDGAGRDG
jgi:hypothetical protein